MGHPHGRPGKPKFPAQGLVRIIRGTYPKLPPIPKSGRCLDLGCGDGANTLFLRREGFDAWGLEIEEGHVEALKEFGGPQYVVGRASALPFPERHFSLVVAWHSVYYMDHEQATIRTHLDEISRVASEVGAVILAIPMHSNFIFEEAMPLGTRSNDLRGVDYVQLTSDPFGLRVGQTFARIEDITAFTTSIEEDFGWTSRIGEERGDWFGLQYDWWVVILQRD